MSDPTDPAAWVAKMRSDLLCIENNLQAVSIPWDAIAYHAQQAGEKALKAFLVSRKMPVPKTHDLGRLLGDCLAAGGALEHLIEECSLLTPMGAAQGYPGEILEISEAEARSAVVAANRIAAAVLLLLSRKQ